MLIHPILDKLRGLNFKGMLYALEEQLALLLDRELTER